jgi:chromosome segregation and condensation protein ScpB
MEHLTRFSSRNLKTSRQCRGKKPTQRVVAAIAYKNGVTQTELAEWHDIGRRTIYSWLKRLVGVESLE